MLKLDPNNITLVKEKQDILKESIEKTSDKLKVLKEAQKQVTEQFQSGDIGRDKYIAFQKELVTTEAKLSDLKKQKDTFAVLKAPINEVKDKVTQLNEKLQPTVDGLKAVGKTSVEIAGGGIKTVTTAVNGAEQALKIYSATALGTATALMKVTTNSALFADDMNTNAKITGLSTAELQKLQYASGLIDVSYDTLSGALSKNTKAMANARDGTESYALAYQTLGVSVTNADGSLRDSQTVFYESIDALSRIENSTERDALAMELFGKSAQDLNPLIDGGAEQLQILGEQAEKSGMILSQDALDGLNAFNDSLDTLKANASASRNVLATQFAGTFKNFTDVIGEGIPSLTSSIKELINGDNTDFTKELTSIGNALFSCTKEVLPKFLNTFNGFILGIVSSVSALLPDAIETLLPVMIDGLTSLVGGLAEIVPDLLPTLVSGGITLFTGLLDGLNYVTPLIFEMIPLLVSDIGAMLIDNLPTIIRSGFELLSGLAKGIAKAIPELITQVSEIIPVIVQELTDNLPMIFDAGIAVVIALATGLPQAIPQLVKAVPKIVGAIIETIFKTDWLDIGVQIIKGIAQGLIEGVKAIGSVIKDVGSAIVGGFKDFFGIHSPSTLFEEQIGTFLADGIGLGFSDEMKKVNRQIQSAVTTSFNSPEIEVNASVSKNGQTGTSQGFTFNQYNSSPKSLNARETARLTRQGLALYSLGVR